MLCCWMTLSSGLEFWVIWMKVGASWAPVACARSVQEDCATDQDFYLNFSIVSVEMSARLGQGYGGIRSGEGETMLQHILLRSVSPLMWVVAISQLWVCALCTLAWLAGSRFPGSTVLPGWPVGQWVPLQETWHRSGHGPALSPWAECPDEVKLSLRLSRRRWPGPAETLETGTWDNKLVEEQPSLTWATGYTSK